MRQYKWQGPLHIEHPASGLVIVQTLALTLDDAAMGELQPEIGGFLCLSLRGQAGHVPAWFTVLDARPGWGKEQTRVSLLSSTVDGIHISRPAYETLTRDPSVPWEAEQHTDVSSMAGTASARDAGQGNTPHRRLVWWFFMALHRLGATRRPR